MAPLRCLFVSALLLLVPSVSFAQSDTTAPSLVEFDFSPRSVDVSAGPQAVTVTARATDDLSGPNRLEVRFTSPTGIHGATGMLVRSGPVNTTLDATFAGTVGILPHVEPGTWIVQVTAFDNTGNSRVLTASDLADGGFPSTLDVASTGAVDTAPPVVVEFGFTPTNPDVSLEPRTIMVTARATDDLSGPETLEVRFTSPSGNETHSAPLSRNGQVNTPLDATFAGSVTLPRFAEPGAWHAELRAWDRLRNERVLDSSALAAAGFPSALDVTSTTPPDSDTTPPALTEFSFSPTSVDVTGAPQAVTISARVTDDLSGISSVRVGFRSPSGRQNHYAFLSRSGPVNSTLDATYSGTLTIPQLVESGTWTADVMMWDSVGNSAFLSAGNLDALGFPTTLVVDSNEDTTAPQVQSAVFSPALIDVSSADQSISIDVRITDDLSGFDSSGPQVWDLGYLASPSAYRYVIPIRAATQVSGDPLDSLWRIEWTIPQYSEAGTWVLYVTARDRAGNSAWRTAGTFEVTATTQDLAAPVLTGLRFSPAVINTARGPATVRVSLDLTDDLSGVDLSQDSLYGGYFHGLFFSSPSSGQSRSASGFTLSAGSVMDGTWEADAYFPQFSESGTWSATVAQVSDRVQNFLYLSAQQIAALGLTSELVVVRPSLVGDGSIDTGGGTVEDDTFGDRASLTFPPGVVGSSTAVAIDVFPDPLAVPTPTGFQGPGTHFVNISLTPEPVYPFPPPGVTATLPLPDFVNPGTALPLFFVNETSGTLEPMPDATTGLQVVGTVNADGLSATFTGISHFSILVGMTPDVVHVDIDIRPKSFPNRVSTLGAGTIPVAVLSTATFDAPATVDPASLTFGRVGDEASLSLCKGNADVNGDGLIDLVCHFNQQATGFGPGDTLGLLRGRTWAGENLVGSDSVRVVQ